MSRRGNYQDSITAPINHASDDDAVARDDEDEQDDLSFEVDPTSVILSAVEKVLASISVFLDINIITQLRKIIRAVRSSPQRKQSWIYQVAASQRYKPDDEPHQRPLVLILDVKTRWSSTHQMMRKFPNFMSLCHIFTIKIGRALEF